MARVVRLIEKNRINESPFPFGLSSHVRWILIWFRRFEEIVPLVSSVSFSRATAVKSFLAVSDLTNGRWTTLRRCISKTCKLSLSISFVVHVHFPYLSAERKLCQLFLFPLRFIVASRFSGSKFSVYQGRASRVYRESNVCDRIRFEHRVQLENIPWELDFAVGIILV